MLRADLNSWSADDLRFALVLLSARQADMTANASHEPDDGSSITGWGERGATRSD